MSLLGRFAIVLLMGACSGEPEAQRTSPGRQGGSPATIHHVGGDVMRPEKLPGEGVSLLSKLAGQHSWRIGFCLLEAVISNTGEVTDVKLVKPANVAPEVEEALAAELKSWRFKPATLQGEPVSVHYTVTVNHCPVSRVTP